MRIGTKVLLGVLGVGLAVMLAAPSAHATCSPAKAFKSINLQTQTYVYIQPDAAANNQNATITGKFWQSDLASVNSGSGCPASYWFRPCPAGYPCGGNPDGRYILGYLNGQNCPLTACPVNELTTLVQDTTPTGDDAFFAVLRVTETTGFDYSRLGSDSQMIAFARPRVTSSSRAATTVTLDLQFDDVASGFNGLSGDPTTTITGYNLYTFTGSADPGRSASAWGAPVQTVAYAAGGATLAAFTVDCSSTSTDVFIAAGLRFSPGVDSEYVSASTRIECDPNLADPGDKFQIIRDRGKGDKKGRPFRPGTQSR